MHEKKVSGTGAKLQIPDFPPGVGDQAGGCAGAAELWLAAGAVPDGSAQGARNRTRRRHEDPDSGKHRNLRLLPSLFRTAYA